MTKPIGIIAGHSHLTCFDVPSRSQADGIELLPLDASGGDFLCLQGAFPWGDEYWETLERLSKDYKLFVFYRGNQHFARHVFASSPLFDFVLADQPDRPLHEDAVIVPEQIVRESFNESMATLGTCLKNVTSRAHHGVVVCGTPPPKDDVAVTRAKLGTEPHFVNRLAAMGTTADIVDLTPPEILYKMWSLIQDITRDVAHRYDATFCPVPVETQTPDGFLRKEFWAADVTHANPAFGKLMLSVLRRYS